jgi:DnaJ family protein A protein 2
MGKNYYDILEIPKNASASDIKKAYRKLALKEHPDKGGDPEKFKEINQANGVLSDPKTKQKYDQYGEDFENKGNGHGMGGMGGMNMEDILKHMTGGMGMGGMGGMRQQIKKCADIEHRIKITLNEVYNGSTRKLKIHRKLICPLCEGFGTKDKSEISCNCDNGKKTVVRQVGPGMIQRTIIICPDCNGTGGNDPKPNNKCDVCAGKCTVNDQNLITVTIQKGVKNGKVIQFPGEANQHKGYKSGNVIIQLIIDTNQTIFDFRGNNLLLNKKINLAEALTGFSFIIEQLDGRKLYIKNDKIIKPNQTLEIKGEGLPIHGNSSNGNLIIQFVVEFPSKVKHSEILSKIFNQRIQEEKESDDYTNVTLDNIGDHDKMNHRIVESDDDSDDGNVQECRQQ